MAQKDWDEKIGARSAGFIPRVKVADAGTRNSQSGTRNSLVLVHQRKEKYRRGGEGRNRTYEDYKNIRTGKMEKDLIHSFALILDSGVGEIITRASTTPTTPTQFFSA